MPAWAGLWNNEGNTNHSLIGKNPVRNRIRRVMNRESMRAVTELFDSLIGAAAGGNAQATHKRVGHFTPGAGSEGGVRTIETITDINRTTTATDVANLKEMTVGVKTAPTVYPVNKANQGINPR
jgi:hypothetical protein